MESERISPEPANYDDVRKELTEVTLRGLVLTVVLGAIGMISCTAVVSYHYHDKVSWTLALLLTLLAMVRVSIVIRLRDSEAYREVFLASKLRERLIDGVLLTYCAVLAVFTLWNFHLHREPVELLCGIGILILCNGISGRAGTNPFTAKLYGVFMLLVLGICVWKPQDELAMTAEVMLGMFAFAHCRAVQEKFDIIVEQIRIQRKLRLLSELDPLTGLMNRRGFCAALDNLCHQGSTFAILFIDLDGFKPVNDNHGHAVGDELLRQVGTRLVSIVRANDIVARLGGDEFAILQLPVTHRRNAETLAERITYALSCPFEAEGNRVTIGASIGISLPRAGEYESALILKRADDALYEAKQAGRGRFVYAEPDHIFAART